MEIGTDGQCALQHFHGVVVITILEVEHSQLVVRRGKMARELDHGPVLFDGGGAVSPCC
jgi:hypothetical protein